MLNSLDKGRRVGVGVTGRFGSSEADIGDPVAVVVAMLDEASKLKAFA